MAGASQWPAQAKNQWIVVFYNQKELGDLKTELNAVATTLGRMVHAPRCSSVALAPLLHASSLLVASV